MPTVPEIITESVLKQLEQGAAPWRKPWSTSIPRNLISKKPYRGLNVFLLATQGYGSPYWLTFNQAKQLGAHVCRGEKSTLVSFWKFNEYAKENRETGETENKTSALLRYYRVFNIEQCEGLKALHGDDRYTFELASRIHQIDLINWTNCANVDTFRRVKVSRFAGQCLLPLRIGTVPGYQEV
jgi:antirestriction protein ArdC